MLLSRLLKTIAYEPPVDLEITGLCLDSRLVQAGNLFFALKGTQEDGKKYIQHAIEKGAAAILTEEVLPIEERQVLIIQLHGLREKVGNIAATFYGHPAEKLQMFGVTGTSGKTSCTTYLADCLTQSGVKCGIIGTLGHGFHGALKDVGLTTPDPILLQAYLAEFVKKQSQAVAMEVSSHSIHQARISSINYDIGVFTNLSQDHLDYHGDMQTYARVKHQFIAGNQTQAVVINLDDEYGLNWVKEIKSKPVCTFSCISPQADVYAQNPKFSMQGIMAEVHTPWGAGEMILPLIGPFNLSNGLAVLSALCMKGMALETCLKYLAKIEPVPGRMQIIKVKDKPTVIIDYAHKPDALEKALSAIKKHTSGKVFCVFGCGGERDRGKRPLMAKIAEQWATNVIVTNDNPRHENPKTIVAEIMQGFVRPNKVIVDFDRSKAIQKSIQWATSEDCVLIAGKGAECYQLIGDKKLPFNDVDEAKQHLCARRSADWE